MAARADIREKFGLDYLTDSNIPTAAATAETPDAEELVEKAAITFGRQILRELKKAKNAGQSSISLNELVDKFNVERDTLSLVVDRLEKLRLVNIEREKYGNHGVRLTSTGEEFLTFV